MKKLSKACFIVLMAMFISMWLNGCAAGIGKHKTQTAENDYDSKWIVAGTLFKDIDLQEASWGNAKVVDYTSMTSEELAKAIDEATDLVTIVNLLKPETIATLAGALGGLVK